LRKKSRVSGGQTGIAKAVLAWSPTVAVGSTWACLKIDERSGATPVAMGKRGGGEGGRSKRQQQSGRM
jgi:hypothetical protein